MILDNVLLTVQDSTFDSLFTDAGVENRHSLMKDRCSTYSSALLKVLFGWNLNSSFSSMNLLSRDMHDLLYFDFTSSRLLTESQSYFLW